MSRDEFEAIALDVAYAFDMDLDEAMKQFDEGEVRVFSSMEEAFEWVFLDDSGVNELNQWMEKMADITPENLEQSECDNVGEYMLLTHSNTKFIDTNLYVFMFE